MQDRREEKQVVCMQRCIKHLYNKTRHRGDRQESVPSYPAAVQRDRWQQGAELWMRGSPWFGKESTLPYFDDEVPVLYLADGTGYIPVVALCRMLGIHMFCGMWTVCSSTRETQASLHLLPGRFYSMLAKAITCSTGRQMLTEDRIVIPFEVSGHIVPLKGAANGREDLYPELSPDRHIPVRSDRTRTWYNEDGPTLDSALTLTVHDILKHLTTRSLILMFTVQHVDRDGRSVYPQECPHTDLEQQAVFKVAQLGIALQVKRKEHQLLFELSCPLTRAQATWLDALLEEASDNRK